MPVAERQTETQDAARAPWPGAPVPILNAHVHDIAMDDLLYRFPEGAMLTLHVDMVMKLQRDRGFYDLLDAFDVITCDSQIIYAALKFLGTPVRERVSGSDFFPRFYMAQKDNPEVTIFLCGGLPGVAEQARDKINAKAGREIVVGTDAPAFDYERRPEEVDRVIAAINASGATACLVGLGGGRQERFIIEHRGRMPGVRLWLPLGGTIDYEAGTLPRPAPWVTDAGLEWAYRLLKQPRARFRRYVIENPPFLWGVLKQKLGIYRDPLNR